LILLGIIANWPINGPKFRQLRTEVNKVMETARNDKAIGASLEAKVLLYVADEILQQELELFNSCDSLTGNKVDELRYLFLSSQSGISQ
jgi:isoleucyl-tRNA synthetase